MAPECLAPWFLSFQISFAVSSSTVFVRILHYETLNSLLVDLVIIITISMSTYVILRKILCGKNGRERQSWGKKKSHHYMTQVCIKNGLGHHLAEVLCLAFLAAYWNKEMSNIWHYWTQIGELFRFLGFYTGVSGSSKCRMEALLQAETIYVIISCLWTPIHG